MINLCAGGETLIASDIVPVIRALLEAGHYLMVVTNGTLTKRFEEIAKFPKELLNRLFFKFSFHYLEFKRLNCMDKFFNNVRMMRDAGCSFTVEATPSDELIPYIDDMKRICIENVGAICHVTVARNERTLDIEPLTGYSWEKYKEIWSVFDSPLFDFKYSIFNKPRKEFCYAGEWSMYIDLPSGKMRQCYCGLSMGNIFKDLDKPVKFLPIGHGCGQPHCYNGHAFLGFGNIPEIETPTYADMRNRVCEDGSEWLTPDMKNFMCQKAENDNHVYTDCEKKKFKKYMIPIRISELPYHAIHTLRPVVNRIKKPKVDKKNEE